MDIRRIETNSTIQYKRNGILILLIMIEVFTGGGGDFYSFHVAGVRITARILLFLLLIGFYLLNNMRRVIYNTMAIPVYCICIYNLLSCVFGMLINTVDASISSYFNSLYLVAFIPMMSHYKDKFASYKVVYNTLLVCATIIATVTLGIYISVNMGTTTVMDMRNTLDSMPGDWWMRTSGGVAYPSQTYIMIAIILILAKTIFYYSNVLEKSLIAYFSLAILSTSTRGLIITLIISAFLVIILGLFKKKIGIKSIVMVVGIMFIIFFFLQYMNISRIYSFADQADGRRITFISEGLDKLFSNPLYVVFGCGFGCELPSTGSLNLEISLFEIFLEQGIVGLILWGAYIVTAIKHIQRGIDRELCPAYMGYGLIFSLVAIVILSFTNPYLNNTVGIICFFIMLLILEHECYETKMKRCFDEQI